MRVLTFLTTLLLSLSFLAQAGAQEPSLTLRRTMTISGHDLDFGEIGAVVADATGQIYVADTHSQAQHIVIVDPQGRKVGMRGGAGRGPGEFRMLQGTLAWAGDTLAAIDQLQRPVHVTLWDIQGRVSTRDWPGDASPAYPTLFTGGAHLYATGMLITPNVIASWDDPPQPKPAPTPQVVAFDGEEGRLLPVSGSGLLEFRLDGVNCGTPDDYIHPMELPFSDGGPFVAFLPGGEVARATRDGAFRIDVLETGSGRIVRTYRRDVQPRPLSDEIWEADRWVRDARRIENEHGELTAQGGMPCPVLDRPTHEPLMRSMVSDEQGRLWVETTTTRGTTLTGIGPRGELLGEVVMPTRDRRVAPYVRANKLYVTTVDDLDVQSIEVFDLVLE